jgi:hypothetical protein
MWKRDKAQMKDTQLTAISEGNRNEVNCKENPFTSILLGEKNINVNYILTGRGYDEKK